MRQLLRKLWCGCKNRTANEGYREAMVGNFSLYDCHGERQHTLYLGEAPEYGKACFKERFEREIHRIKARYPDALYRTGCGFKIMF
jgi:hypothetical protein